MHSNNMDRSHADFQKRFTTGPVTQKKTFSTRKCNKMTVRHPYNINRSLADSQKRFAARPVTHIKIYSIVK